MNLGETVTRDYLRHELEDIKYLLERMEAKLDDVSAEVNDSPEDLSEPVGGDVIDSGEDTAINNDKDRS